MDAVIKYSKDGIKQLYKDRLKISLEIEQIVGNKIESNDCIGASLNKLLKKTTLCNNCNAQIVIDKYIHT